ncbi:putative YcjX-like family ATPase [Sinorhizobium fredii]|uniref:Uncharacterized protein n=1 Tax=Sinorhizobium fredii (strain USDA 257) TaxID=1185652 RepID=I3XB95_SINF2|nr:hypothetical protein [Sinorhizobium fredii]AFL53151.1 hypothetical protein USDA257_c46130 [Sinorhizobium fredii USDA 257]
MPKEKLNLRNVPDDQWTDEHEAELRRRVAQNPDDFLLPEDAEGRPFAEVFPEWAKEIEQRRRERR